MSISVCLVAVSFPSVLLPLSVYWNTFFVSLFKITFSCTLSIISYRFEEHVDVFSCRSFLNEAIPHSFFSTRESEC